MIPYRMDNYGRAVAAHRLETPAAFNFGADVVDVRARDPSKPALVWCDAAGNGRRLTFDDVARASNRVANRLAARGVAKGDRVVVMLPPCRRRSRPKIPRSCFVIAAPGFTSGDALAAELQDHVKRMTAPYKYPRRIEFVESLPKTVSGKIQRNVLRQAYSQVPPRAAGVSDGPPRS